MILLLKIIFDGKNLREKVSVVKIPEDIQDTFFVEMNRDQSPIIRLLM